MADPLNALYDRDDPFGFGQDETERLRASMTHAAPDAGLARRIARDKAIVAKLPPFKQVGDLWNALTSPLTAEETYGDPVELTKRAMGLQSAQFTGAGFVRPKGASAGVFAGPGAANAPELAYRMAAGLERRGYPRDEIWDATRVAQGVEGKWRHEISDAPARMRADPGGGRPVGEVMSHPELYNAYPWAKNIPTEFNPGLRKGAANTWYNAHGKVSRIEYGPGSFDEPSITLHELQHPIQDVEGWASGGAPIYGTSPFNADLAKLTKEVPNLMQTMLDRKLPREVRDAAEKRSWEIRRILDKHREYREARDKAAFENYSRLAGEVEARNVQYRWAQDQRNPNAGIYNIPPWETETMMKSGVPRNQQIIAPTDFLGGVGPRVLLGPRNELINPMYERY